MTGALVGFIYNPSLFFWLSVGGSTICPRGSKPHPWQIQAWTTAIANLPDSTRRHDIGGGTSPVKSPRCT